VPKQPGVMQRFTTTCYF